MAGQRGFGGRSRDDLYAAAESVSEMLAQLKGMSGRGGGRGAGPPHQAQSEYYSEQEWEEKPRNPEGSWQRSRSQGGPRDYYPPDPSPNAIDCPWEPPEKPRNQRQNRGDYRQQTPREEWEERPRNPEGSWQRGRSRGQRGRSRGGPQPSWPPRDHYPPDPSPEQMGTWEPPMEPRNQWQNRGDYRQQTPRGPGDPVTAQHLVMALTQSTSFSIGLLNLLEHHNFPPTQVRNTVAHHGHLFQLQEEVVSLTPRLKLCTAHSSHNGCQRLKVCDSLHICPKYVLTWCNEGVACVFGHKWHTNHNLAMLKRLSMQYVKFPVLRELLRRINGQGQDGVKHKAGPLEVCQAYNEAGCDQLRCPSLHACLSFVVGLTNCTRDKCQLNHDLLSPACCHLLKMHDLSVNEAPRDVATALLQANPGLKDKVDTGPSAKPRPAKAAAQGQARKDNNNKDAKHLLQQPGSSKKQASARKESKEKSSSASDTESETDDSDGKGKKSRGAKESHASKAKAGRHSRRGRRGSVKRVSDDSESSATETDSEEESDDKGRGRKNAQKPLPKQQQDNNASRKPGVQVAPKPTPRRTLWAHYLYGDVAVPQICYYSVETMCRDEESGCPKLHAVIHFHWQVKEQDGRWINLRFDQVTCLERAFCDPALSGVNLPRLDPSKLDPSVGGLFLLLGRDVWQADFSTSSLINSTKSRKLQLRRLCTEPVTGQAIKASSFHWYFLDINQKWVKYGNVDTAGNQKFVSSITSADIESHYLKTPQQPLSFNNAQFTFVLDLISMKQTNQLTGMSRAVQRRPEEHLPKEEDKAKAASDLPTHWDAMQPEERSRLVTLGPASDEYKKVVSLLGTKVSAANVVKVDRIQNPFMWRALQNKIKDMTALYKNATLVNVQQLFHGTSHNVVASICNENFDWRLHGTSAGQSFGRGTYFGTDAGISYGYSRPDPSGLKYIFVARVAIGSVTTGNSTMARPPINPATLIPYDSTVNNPTNPSMVIKYSTQEYYPEYLFTLK